jgi:hypothetical protein
MHIKFKNDKLDPTEIKVLKHNEEVMAIKSSSIESNF